MSLLKHPLFAPFSQENNDAIAAANKSVANYNAYSRIFNNEFNFFFCLKKTNVTSVKQGVKQCQQERTRTKLEEFFNDHQEEKELSRTEKAADKAKAKKGKITISCV